MPKPVIRLNQLTKVFDRKPVLNDISTTSDAGDIVGILGKNGAGKTTLLEIMLGFGPPTAGSVELFGDNSMTLSEGTKSRIGFVPQRDELIESLTGQLQLDVLGSFYKNTDRDFIRNLADKWQVPLENRIQTLSVGERQKLSLLLALGHDPDLLVLDEPVAVLDPLARRQFLQQIVEIADTAQQTVLFSSHIVSDLERVANRIWILKDGQLAWQGNLDDLKESVVRLHIRSSRALPIDLSVPNMLGRRVEGTNARISTTQWIPAQQAVLAEQLHAKIEVEPLGLEEIFLELHQ
jgi:ABC-2 type transport system ATP-binding protein